jgi:Ca-activated chloride channel homolog
VPSCSLPICLRAKPRLGAALFSKHDPSHPLTMKTKLESSPFGLIAHLASTRISLPLSHIETRFRITGEVAVVEMDQVYEQTARQTLDVRYTFPLPSDAAVFRCEMIINGRCIRAKVMEENEARQLVKEKKAAGRRTALVEQVRGNVFELQLGNTAPGDRIVIRLAYVQQLERLGMQLGMSIPFTPGVRYIPGKPLLRANRGPGAVDDTDAVPDASRISPPRISGGHVDAATMYLHGLLDDAEVSLNSVTCSTHTVVMRSESGGISVELCDDDEVPDRDFRISWAETLVQAEPKPHSWHSVWQRPDGSTELYALLQIRAPQAETVVARDELAQDFYFLLDRSGSMEGANWKAATRALLAFVKELGSQDKVWLTCFENEYQDFSDELMLRDEMLADQGFLELEKIGVGGGTELLPALEHVLEVKSKSGSQNRARFILITDGQVGNDEAIIHRMAEAGARGITVHTFGIDRAVNDVFLKKLAKNTGGRCALMTPEDDIPAAVQKLAVTLRRPVLTGMSLTGRYEMPEGDVSLPDLHAGEVTLLPVRCAAEQASALTLNGSLADGSAWQQAYALRAPAEGEERTMAPRLLYAQRHCDYLLSEGQIEKAVAIAVEHNVICEGTSFVAWDEVEKVPAAKHEVYQPSVMMEEFKTVLRSPAVLCRSVSSPSSYAAGSVTACLSYDEELLRESVPEEHPLKMKLPASLHEVLDRYAYNEEDERGRKLKTELYACLIGPGGMDSAVAELLVMLLLQWAAELMSQSRYKALQRVCDELRKDGADLMALEKFIEDLPQLELRKDALLLYHGTIIEADPIPPSKQKRSLKDLGKE